jgi:hypothetical protein
MKFQFNTNMTVKTRYVLPNIAKTLTARATESRENTLPDTNGMQTFGTARSLQYNNDLTQH